MKIDRTLQLRYFRKLWRASEPSPEKVYYLLQYTKVRYLLACRVAPKNWAKRKSQKAMRKFWQITHSRIEEIASEYRRPFEVFELSTRKNFESYPHYQNSPLSAKTSLGTRPSNCQTALFDAPHGWHELLSPPLKARGESPDFSEDLEEEDGEDNSSMSWQEFYQRLCLFEEKMQKAEAERAQDNQKRSRLSLQTA